MKMTIEEIIENLEWLSNNYIEVHSSKMIPKSVLDMCIDNIKLRNK
jgi:hypothetical protein